MITKLTTEGEAFFAEGNLAEAKDRFLAAVKDDPQDKNALNNLGVIAFQEKQIDHAARYFSQCLSIDPFYLDGVLNFCQLLKATDNLGGAANLLEMVATRYPENDEIKQLLDEAQACGAPTVDGAVAAKLVQADSSSPESSSTLTKDSSDPLADKKVLLAPFEIAGCIERITRYLRRENIDATSANYYDSWLQYKCDVNLNVSNMSPEERNRAIDKFACEAIDKYDIFHFHFAHSLYPDLRDLKELREKGKKILFSFWGSDARGMEWIMYQQARFLGHRPPRPYAITRQQYQIHKAINLYADVLIGLESIPRGIWVRGFADTAQWSLEGKQACLEKNLVTRDPKKTYFVHAPSNQFKKGSAILMRLLKECQDEGMPIEVLYVSQMAPGKAREIYAYGDYAIDQVGVGTYGLFGVEMMCWEIPVLVYHTELFDRLRGNPPVIQITKENFKSRIERCIEMKNNGEIDKLGAESRKWAIEKEDVTLAIPEYLRIYRDLAEGKQILQYVNRAWYEEESRMQRGFKSEFYKYMVEQNVFDEMGMAVPEYDRQLYY